MHDEQKYEQEPVTIEAIPKHSYPLLIKFFSLLAIIPALYNIPKFILYDLTYHRELHSKISLAEKTFQKKDYPETIRLYLSILEKHPNYKKGKILVAKSFFAISSYNDELYFAGLSYLSKEKYTFLERTNMLSFLPKKYHSHFKRQFA